MKQANNKSKARDCFADRVQKSLVGPGSENEIWGLDDIREEVISDFPLIRYYTGVLFPEKAIANNNDDIEEVEEIVDDEVVEIDDDITQTDDKEKEKEEDSIVHVGQNNFFPSSCGITLCVSESISEVEVAISFGLYYTPKQTEVKIKISEEGYYHLINTPEFPLKDILVYENGFMYLIRELKGERRGAGASGDYARLYQFQNSEAYKDSPVKYFFPLVQKLYGRIWKRKYISTQFTLPIEDNIKGVEIYKDDIISSHRVSARIFTKRYTHKGNPYFKVLFANCSTAQSPTRFTSQTNELNRKAFFQSEIKVTTSGILPYKSKEELNPIDEEANTLNFLYRNVKSYAIGHNCSATWDTASDSAPQEVRTTFFPDYQVRDVRNKFVKEDFNSDREFEQLNKCLDIHSLSHFAANKSETITRLRQFVDLYRQWIEGQVAQANEIDDDYSEVAQKIVEDLKINSDRLYSNIELLNDDMIFRAFSLANTAMLIQIIISNDESFAKREKLLSEIDACNSSYNDLSFFDGYTAIKPAYRPFQLAFMLLNIESITNPDSPQRNEIVDLIWFPTGGGKTEAYLAVAAFSIIWRRLSNDDGYQGTAVIMRYTLRLLTAQQFERASRLIATLEFLRKNFEKELKSEPINIGLWVGQSSTPNTIAEAGKIIEELDKEVSKGAKGEPENKNTFQVSSCPWCGAKLVNKYANGSWNIEAFQFNPKKRQFYFSCPNHKCTFNKRLPIQVVDDMLYGEPPTLLFATVDKFAMLAWKEDGHRFFNSLSDKGLPPELIIQDELHLLSGALGSITAIFESVVEMLCTKDGRKPKILASTATTRNTTHQIEQLYGNRKVNIFPPTGLSYDDSFFARESKDSRRKYIGFMPTGKTAVDTQLRVLANLLVARMDIYRDPELREECFNDYWSIVSYYNSLKDVGRTNNKISDEVYTFTQTLQKRLFGANDTHYEFNYRGLRGRVKELTSREQSGKIKQTLKELEAIISTSGNIKDKENGKYVENAIDLVLATNMISVGIDISRLNIMLINGQPKNIAEYIQASSRVSRSVDGLVISLLDANRARDKSYFEHYIPFHQAFYKSVEPLSITPFTENTIDKMLMSIAVIFVRHKIVGRNLNADVVNFEPSDLDDFIAEIERRYGENPYFTAKINHLRENWAEMVAGEYKTVSKYDDKIEGLLCKPQSKTTDNQHRVVMQSMREIDTNTFVKIFIKDPKMSQRDEQE